MKAQQEFAKKFENYLLDYVTCMGMTPTPKPTLRDGKTPDFLVEYKGRACYVEATHIQWPDEFREKKGEADLREILDERAPKSWQIILKYATDERRNLTDPISKRARGIKEVVDWLSNSYRIPEGEMTDRKVQFQNIPIKVQAYRDATAEKDRVSWDKLAIWKPDNKLRDSLKDKYDKYTSDPNSLGDIPLIIAILDEMLDEQGMTKALYGRRIPYIPIDGATDEPVGVDTRIQYDGVWLNARSGKLEKRHNHLAAVWHFRAVGDAQRAARLFPNPYRKDIESIIPEPMLKHRVANDQ